MLEFEWDEDKAKFNYIKHNVNFEEAITVFNDNLSLTIFDDKHSLFEERYIDIGISNKNRILVVVYTERKNKIRIISARLANKNEIKHYEQ
jgi:uncharacterized DUF497 family protein